MTTDEKEATISENGCLKEKNEHLFENKLDFKNSSTLKTFDSKVENKSSTEILTELFSVFNAEPPVIEEGSGDGEKPVKSCRKNSVNHRSSESAEEDSAGDRVKEKKGEKKKKEKKKKHKHKSSKHRHSSKKESESSGLNRLHRSREKDKDDIATYSKIKEKILKASASNSKSATDHSPASMNDKTNFITENKGAVKVSTSSDNSVGKIVPDLSSNISTEETCKNEYIDLASVCLPEPIRIVDGPMADTKKGDTQGLSSEVLIDAHNEEIPGTIEIDIIPLPEDCASQEHGSSDILRSSDIPKISVKNVNNCDCEASTRTVEFISKGAKVDTNVEACRVNESLSMDRTEALRVHNNAKCDCAGFQKPGKCSDKSELADSPVCDVLDVLASDKVEPAGSDRAETSGKNVKPSSAVAESKAKSKIKIKNLKFSTVFQQTLKEAEEQARKKEEEKQEEKVNNSPAPDATEKVSENLAVGNGESSPQNECLADPGNADKSCGELEGKKLEEPLIVSKEDTKLNCKDMKEDVENSGVLIKKENSSESMKKETEDHSCKAGQEFHSNYEEISKEVNKEKSKDGDTSTSKKRSRSRSVSKVRVKEKKKRSRSKSREKTKKSKKRSKSPTKAKSRSRSVSKRKRRRSRSGSKGGGSKSKRKARSRSRSKDRRKENSGREGRKAKSRSKSKERRHKSHSEEGRKVKNCSSSKETGDKSHSREERKAKSRSRSKGRGEKSRSRERKNESHSREERRKKSRSRSKGRSKGKVKRSQSRSKERRRRKSRSMSKERNNSRSQSVSRKKSMSVSPEKSRSVSPKKSRSMSPKNSRSMSPKKSRSVSLEKSVSPKTRSVSPKKSRSISKGSQRSGSESKSRMSRSKSGSVCEAAKESRSRSKSGQRSTSKTKGESGSGKDGDKKSESRSRSGSKVKGESCLCGKGGKGSTIEIKQKQRSKSRSKSAKPSVCRSKRSRSRHKSQSRSRKKSRSTSRVPHGKRSSSQSKRRSRSQSHRKSRSRSHRKSRSRSRRESKRRSQSRSRRARSSSRRKSRSRSRRKSRSRSRKKSRSRSRKKSRSRSRRKSRSRSRKKSRSRSRRKSRSRSRRKSRSRSRRKSRSRSKRKSRSRSKRKSRSRSRRKSSSRSRRKSRSRSRRKSRSRSRRKSRSRSRRKSRSRSRRKSRSRSRKKSRSSSHKRSLSLIKCWRKSRSRSHGRRSRERSKGRGSHGKKRSLSRKRSRSHSCKKRSPSCSKKRSKSAERRSRSRSRKRSKGEKEKESRRSKTVEKSKLAAAGGSESAAPSSVTSGDVGKSGEGEEEKLDKARLLEIARKNAVNLLQQGSLPPSVVGKDQKGKLLSLKAGGKSVEELTEYCKELSRKEAMGESSDSDCDGASGSGSHAAPVIHHPFQIKERPTPGMIGIGIRTSLPPANAIMDKPSDQSKLRMQFPVSSGQEHRKTESDSPLAICYHEETSVVEDSDSVPGDILEEKEKIIADPKDQVFPDYSNCEQNMDIGSIVSQRLTALRKLQENPDDIDALNEMTQAQKDMQVWAESKSQPGLFTGSTGAKVLSAAELASGSQAWARKDQLKCATPLTGGMGMLLLQKMGWRPGEGLGKNKEGVLEPLRLDVKTDKRGLVSQEELHRHTNVHRRGHIARSHSRHSFGKHPVSVLVEICSKRRWKVPHFQLVFESGPDHKKSFLFKAIVNGVEYLPPAPSPNKKQAKAHAASICLQAIGVYPPSMGYEGACV